MGGAEGLFFEPRNHESKQTKKISSLWIFVTEYNAKIQWVA